MKIVIDIPDRIKYGVEKGITVNGSRASQIVLDAVKNGTPLPKGHGRLIDADELLKAIDTWDKFGIDDTNSLFRLDNLSLPHYVPYIHYDDMVKSVSGAETIIGADKESENGNTKN